MDANLIPTSTPATGLTSLLAPSAMAPTWSAQGAALSFAGSAAVSAHASVAVAGARTTDLPVPAPRGAPV